MKHLAKLIRTITTPPIFAAALCTLLHLLLPGSFASTGHYLLALLCLTALPLLAYPVVWCVPALRRRGRSAERTLGLIFSVTGYLTGFLVAMLRSGAPMEKFIFATYLLSGLVLAVCTLCHFKASAHTCGCSGPLAMLSVFVSPWFLFAYSLLTPIFWSSRKLGRHSAAQLITGAIIPVLAMFLCRVEFLV